MSMVPLIYVADSVKMKYIYPILACWWHCHHVLDDGLIVVEQSQRLVVKMPLELMFDTSSLLSELTGRVRGVMVVDGWAKGEGDAEKHLCRSIETPCETKRPEISLKVDYRCLAFYIKIIFATAGLVRTVVSISHCGCDDPGSIPGLDISFCRQCIWTWLCHMPTLEFLCESKLAWQFACGCIILLCPSISLW